MTVRPGDILDFWYTDDISAQWFNATMQLDKYILTTYESTWKQAVNGELDHWQYSAEGCLALAIVLDQFPLNMYRGKPQSFASESLAINVSLWAISQGFDTQLPKGRLAFLYMPLMHSENITHQTLSVKKFESAGLEKNVRFARHHREIIERFGRFPHRNAILGRENTAAELKYLSSSEAFTG